MSALAPAWANHGAVSGMLSALATLAALLLLLAFQQVVTGAVTQGALRRSLAAQLHTANWQCKALRSLQERSDCLALIPLATKAVDAARSST